MLGVRATNYLQVICACPYVETWTRAAFLNPWNWGGFHKAIYALCLKIELCALPF
jgi:hypothetical protein